MTQDPTIPTALALLYVAAALLATASAIRYRIRTKDRRATSALVFSAVLLAFAVSAVVAVGGLNGLIRDQGTITFWSAATRAFAAVLALDLAWRWWRASDNQEGSGRE